MSKTEEPEYQPAKAKTWKIHHQRHNKCPNRIDMSNMALTDEARAQIQEHLRFGFK